VNVERVISASYILQPNDPFGGRFPEEFDGKTPIRKARKTQGFIAAIYGKKEVNEIEDALSPRTAKFVFAFLDSRRERMKWAWDKKSHSLETLYD